MKKILLILFLVLAAAIGALATTFSAQKLEVPAGAPITVPPARPPQDMKLSALLTGKLLSSAAFAYRGGSFREEREFNMGAILVQHPKGTLLFDAGFGRNVDTHIQTTPWLLRATTKYVKETPVAEQLRGAGIALPRISGVVLTHAHWDHVSGLEDLAGVPVWVTQQELDFVNSGHELAVLAKQLGTRDYKIYAFSNGPYLGFPASYDVFGDGSVVLVPAQGHTPGSVIAFITLPSGQRYALVGDIVWQTEGVDLPAEKPWLARRTVDYDAGDVREVIVHLHRIKQAIPDMVIVPAHDRRVWEKLPRL